MTTPTIAHGLEDSDAYRTAVGVVRRLRNSGHTALLAGGCVRDMLLGEIPTDYDIATSARPEQVTALFRRTLQVGAQFGVVVVMIDRDQLEVATFRNDAGYSDGRRPDQVHFSDAREDALRRDFTINGMFYDPVDHAVIDYVNGQEDLDAGIVRAIGCAEDRFAEDHLRMLRAVRFAGRLGFNIEPDTRQAIEHHHDKLVRISPERIFAEMEKILVNANRLKSLELIETCGLGEVIFDPFDTATLAEGRSVLEHLKDHTNLELIAAGLLCMCDPKTVTTWCRHMRTSNAFAQQTVGLIENRRTFLDALPLTDGRLKRWIFAGGFDDLTTLCRAYLAAQGLSQGPLDQVARQRAGWGESLTPPEPLLDGHDLIAMGITAGPVMGELIDALYLAQLEGEIATAQQAREWVKRHYPAC